MTLAQTSLVKYSANERIDLDDKTAEESLRDDFVGQMIKGSIQDDTDGRIFQGFKTSTVVAPNSGFTIPAGAGFAVSRDGKVIIKDPATALTSVLASNAINYVHLHYDETDTAQDNRRFYSGGAEATQSTFTRKKRVCGIYVTTTAYGAPSLPSFQTSASIGGVTRQLIPLYAVRVTAGNNVDSITDYRPLFAIGATNSYTADPSHNFAPADGATLGLTSIRSTLVAVIDRLKQLKQTTNWYSDSFGDVLLLGEVKHTNAALTMRSIDGSWITLGDTDLSSVATYGAATHVFATVAGGASLSFNTATGQAALSNGVDFNFLYTGASDLLATRVMADTTGAIWGLRKARGTQYSPAAVISGDVLGGLQFQGRNNTSYADGAYIRAICSQTPSTSTVPTDIVFGNVETDGGALTERMRILRSGNVGIGTSTPVGLLHVVSNTFNTVLEHNSNTIYAHALAFYKSRGTHAAPSSVQLGDYLGAITFRGFELDDFYEGASIAAFVDYAPSSGSGLVPSRLVFSTVSPSTGAAEAMRIDYDGFVRIGPSSAPAPAEALTVMGNIRAEDTSANYITLLPGSPGTIKSSTPLDIVVGTTVHAKLTSASGYGNLVVGNAVTVSSTDNALEAKRACTTTSQHAISAASVTGTSHGKAGFRVNNPGAYWELYTANSSATRTHLRFAADGNDRYYFETNGSMWASKGYFIEALTTATTPAHLTSRHGYNNVVSLCHFKITNGSGAPTLQTRHFNVVGITRGGPAQYVIELDQPVHADTVILVSSGKITGGGAKNPYVWGASFNDTTHVEILGYTAQGAGAYTLVEFPIDLSVRVALIGSPDTLPTGPT